MSFFRAIVFVLLLVFGFCLFYLLLNPATVLKSDSFNPVVCRNHLNEPIDWFIIYKLPIQSHSSDSSIANGTGYIYLDSSSSLDQWHKSVVSMSSNLSITGLTLAPLYQSSENSYIFYNDQPPNMPVSMSYGHSKGVLAFDEKTDSGFWLIHSVPHFPIVVNKGYKYPDSGSFTC